MVFPLPTYKGKFRLEAPIYILINERTFSAASVFAGALKGAPNITLVGVRSDGSSGLSKKYRLPHSQIEVKLSTMLSFQRDGHLFDGNGTGPDLVVERSLDQIMGKEDFQLNYLLDKIRSQQLATTINKN